MVRAPTVLPRVVVDHEEPLLALGLRAALLTAPRIKLADDDSPVPGVPVQVLVTDWSKGLRWLSSSDAARPASLLVITSQVREQPVLSALRRGLNGLLLGSCTASELFHAVEALAMGRTYVCAEVAQRVAAHFLLEPLTGREEAVLQLLARGLCNKSIASNLGIGLGTVKSHVKAILGKLAASTRTEAARIAAELGIVELARSPRFELAPLH